MPTLFRFARLALLSAFAALLLACATPPTVDTASLQQQVTQTETAFAKTMADRDLTAFASFLADDTVFFAGAVPLRSKAAVVAAWARFYAQPEAPFSWKPETVQVLQDGTLALSSGPVFDASGKAVASFTSVWRQQSPGVWRIVFDKGCNCP